MLVGATCILRDYRREDRTISLAARVSTIHDRSVTVPVWLKSIILRLGDIDWTLGSNFPKRASRKQFSAFTLVHRVVQKAQSDDSNNLNSVVNRIEAFDEPSDPVEAADPYAQYRTLQSDTPLPSYASNGKVDLPAVLFGGTGDTNGDGLQLASLQGAEKFDLANPTDKQIDGLARALQMSPAETRDLLRRVELQIAAEGFKTLGEPISKEEQSKRLAEASQEISEAMGKISTGAANPGDLADLLNSYSKLNGFSQGALAQGAVGQMMDRVRSVLAAVAEGRALGNFDYASIIHNRRTRADMQQEFANKNRRTQNDV